MKQPFDSLVVDLICRVMVPFILIFALYVVAHGHYSPGGGFQGGTMLAAGVLLFRLCVGSEYSYAMFPPTLALIFGGLGTFVFAAVGALSMVGGGNYLDYEGLPIPGISGPQIRYYSVLVVEAAIALAVFGILVAVYDRLVDPET